jgi:hypothetical protein
MNGLDIVSRFHRASFEPIGFKIRLNWQAACRSYVILKAIMKLQQISPDRFEFTDTGGKLTEYMRYFLIAVTALVVFNAIATGSFAPVILVLIAAMGFSKLAGYVDVDTHASFDRTSGEFYLRQTRRGKLVEERTVPLDGIENVVVEADHRDKATDNAVKTRPAVVIEGRSVPLTFASFLSGPAAAESAQTLRRFLELPDTDLIDDSIRQALKGPVGTGPAVRLARLGKGLGRLDAAAYVRSIEGQADPVATSRTPTHAIRREQS